MLAYALKTAFGSLEQIYRRLDESSADRSCRACGICCHFKDFGHRLYATRLEALFLLAKSGGPPHEFTENSCGYQEGSRCLAWGGVGGVDGVGVGGGRVLGCRLFFCREAGGYSSDLHERTLAEIKEIAREAGVDAEYGGLGALIQGLWDASEAKVR